MNLLKGNCALVAVPFYVVIHFSIEIKRRLVQMVSKNIVFKGVTDEFIENAKKVKEDADTQAYNLIHKVRVLLNCMLIVPCIFLVRGYMAAWNSPNSAEIIRGGRIFTIFAVLVFTICIIAFKRTKTTMIEIVYTRFARDKEIEKYAVYNNINYLMNTYEYLCAVGFDESNNTKRFFILTSKKEVYDFPQINVDIPISKVDSADEIKTFIYDVESETLTFK